MHVDHLDRHHLVQHRPHLGQHRFVGNPAVHDPGVAYLVGLAAGHPAGRDCGEPSRISIRNSASQVSGQASLTGDDLARTRARIAQ